jgi:hypothetical protein
MLKYNNNKSEEASIPPFVHSANRIWALTVRQILFQTSGKQKIEPLAPGHSSSSISMSGDQSDQKSTSPRPLFTSCTSIIYLEHYKHRGPWAEWHTLVCTMSPYALWSYINFTSICCWPSQPAMVLPMMPTGLELTRPSEHAAHSWKHRETPDLSHSWGIQKIDFGVRTPGCIEILAQPPLQTGVIWGELFNILEPSGHWGQWFPCMSPAELYVTSPAPCLEHNGRYFCCCFYLLWTTDFQFSTVLRELLSCQHRAIKKTTESSPPSQRGLQTWK